MSYTKQVTIWCDTCSEWEQRSEVKVATIRRELRALGWTCVRGDEGKKDYCPACSAGMRP